MTHKDQGKTKHPEHEPEHPDGRESFDSGPMKFAALMAHQMQSPLTAISAALQNVLGEYTGPLLPQHRDLLEKANTRCDQAISAVHRMLAIVRGQMGDAPSSAPAPVGDVLRQIHSEYTAEAVKYDITLDVETTCADARTQLGENALSEVLRALVHNAVKYTPDHGRILISAETSKDGKWICIYVDDSGPGVADAEKENIFKPFYRTPAVRESTRPGVGLGLTFVQSITTVGGGEVTVSRSTLGGARFGLRLPALMSRETAAGAPAPRAVFHVLIIGGVTAGPKAAAKIIRLHPDADVTIIEKDSLLSYAGCGLPYYVAGLVRDQKRLISSQAGVVRDLVFFRDVKNVHVLNQTEAMEIDRAGKRVRVRDAVTHRESWLGYDKLLIATGASPVVPASLKSSLKNVFTLHGMRDAEGIRAALASGGARDVVIVGGGLIGIEMTEALVSKGARVTIVEKLPHILPMVDEEIALLVEQNLEANGVRVLKNTPVLALVGEGAVSAVKTAEGNLACDMVILAVGVKPNVQLGKSCGLKLGSTGAIAVDAYMQTSDPDILAAGDCVETRDMITDRATYVPLGSTATKQARVAAVNICGGREVFPGIVGSCICKVFEYGVGRTGLGELDARALGFDVVTAMVPGPDRAHYMPTVAPLLLKLIVDRASRRLLGVQATGTGASDKRIDVAAMAIRAHLTVDELANADLCYAPPYSPTLDNLITAANVARNKLDGHMTGVSPSEVNRMLNDRVDFVFLDVRTPEEHERVRLPKSTLIPLGAIRGRMGELPRDKDIVTFCDSSLRGYEAALMLQSAGFKRVRVMDGGMAMWPYEKLE